MFFDLPPDPPKLWLPSRPAIIRPLTPDLLKPVHRALVKARRRSPAPSGVTSITYVDNATSAGNTITIPATAAIGDIAVLFDGAAAAAPGPSDVVPTGWTKLGTSLMADESRRFTVSYKILTSGNPGASITGLDGSAEDKVMLVFRPNVPITSVFTSTWTVDQTAANPAAQTVTASGQTTPLVVLGGCFSSTTAAFSGNSPAFTAEFTNSGSDVRAGYTIYDSSPVNHTVDMGDTGDNGLASGYIRVT